MSNSSQGSSLSILNTIDTSWRDLTPVFYFGVYFFERKNNEGYVAAQKIFGRAKIYRITKFQI